MPEHKIVVLSDPQQDNDQETEERGADSAARQAKAEDIGID